MSDSTPPAPPEILEPAPEVLHGCPVTWSIDQKVVHVTQARYLEVVKRVVDDGFHVLVDITAVDHLLNRARPVPADLVPERFEVVVNLLSMSPRARIRLRVQVPEADPTLPTLFDLFPGSEAAEREVFDMFGIRFDGHPDLSRILMPEDWEGHPLRKDFAMGKIPVQFKAAPGAR